MSCLDSCAQDLPEQAVFACNPTTMKGGFRALAFMKCDASFDGISGGISAVSAWETLVASGDIVFTGQILGSKAKGSATTQRLASCLPEVVTGRTQTIQFRDYNADLTTLSHYDFWITIQENYLTYKVLAITCEGYVYGPYEDKTWTLDIDDVREETSEAPAYMDGTVTIDSLLMVKPVLVDGILSILP